MAPRSRRSLVVSGLQYALAAVTLVWLVSQIEFAEALSLLGRVDAPTVIAVLVVTAVGYVGRFYTWQAVMAHVHPVSLRTAAETDLIVNFLNQLLPSRLSGRVAAPFVVRRQTGMSYADAVAVSGVHTAVYAVIYGLTSAVGLGLAVSRLSVGVSLLIALSTALYLVAGTTVLLAGANLTALDRFVAVLKRLVARLPRVGTILEDRVDAALSLTAASSVAFRRLASSADLWVRYAVGWTLALVLAPGLRVLLLLWAVGVSFEPAAALPLYLVAAYSVTLLPLTPGGIGVSEATATLVLVALGVPGSLVVPIVLVDRLLGVYLPALGGWYPSLGLDVSERTPDE